MSRRLVGSIALTKMKHYIVNIKNKKGEKVRGIFIPVSPDNPNHLTRYEKDGEVSYFMPVRVQVRDEADQYNQHGFIAQAVASKTFKEATPEQQEVFNKLPILGNLREFQKHENEGNMGDATVGTDDIEYEGGDLPF